MNLSPQNICKVCMHRNHQNKSSIASCTKGKNIYWLSKEKGRKKMQNQSRNGKICCALKKMLCYSYAMRCCFRINMSINTDSDHVSFVRYNIEIS